jgi:hypothetical protein
LALENAGSEKVNDWKVVRGNVLVSKSLLNVKSA